MKLLNPLTATTKERSVSPGMQTLTQLSFVGQSWNDSISTAECEVSDCESLRSGISGLSTRSGRGSRLTSMHSTTMGQHHHHHHKDIVLSTEIQRVHKASQHSSHRSSMTAEHELEDISNVVVSKRDEFHVFRAVMDDTRLGLSCNRRYSFSLIHPNREYILSAETGEELKEWISIFNKLTQGKPLYSGYLALRDDKATKKKRSESHSTSGSDTKRDTMWNTKFFILFENKVLNYYRDHNEVSDGTACEFDIDLRHVMWLRFTKKNEFEVDLDRHFGANNDSVHGNSNGNEKDQKDSGNMSGNGGGGGSAS